MKAAFNFFQYSDNGFSYEETYTAWADIESIIAYKTDEFTTDTIHLVLKKADETELHFSEYVEDWFHFTEKLKENLPGIDKEWFRKVVTPAFETRETPVYKKGEILGNQ